MCKSDPGNIDLLSTMPLPDSAANAGTPMPKNIGAHEGAEFESKEFANLILSNCQIISGTEMKFRNPKVN